jgi:microcystin-dependent protein
MSEPFIGQIQAFGFNFPPRGWATCDGQLLAISSNTALFSLLGTTYGGDGRTTFGLPDLRGRSIVHVGTGPGLDTISWGERAGTYQKNIAVSNLPSHNHSVSVSVNTGTGEEPNVTSYISNHAGAFHEEPTAGTFLGGVNENDVGGGQSMNIRNPYLGMYVCIALVGLFPSRN